MINAHVQDLLFTIQQGQAGEWQRITDTSLPPAHDFSEAGAEPVLQSLTYAVKARSLVVLLRRR